MAGLLAVFDDAVFAFDYVVVGFRRRLRRARVCPAYSEVLHHDLSWGERQE